MKKLLLTAALISGFVCQLQLFGQVSAYTFAQSAGATTALTAGYTQHTSGTTDFGTYTNINIGFTFNYNGTDYTAVSICNDGWICMGTTISSSYTPLSSGTSNNVIAALAADLQGLGTGSLRSKTEGTAPNRTFTVEWLHYEKYSSADDFNFQIILYETTNVIRIKYDNTACVGGNAYQVGLRGSSSADYNNRTKAQATNFTSSTAGTANTDQITVGSTAARSPNGIYTWTPAPMSYVSCTTTQPNTNSVSVNSTNQEVICIQVVTSGSASPLSMTSLTFNTTGTTAPATDIQNAKIWFTGTSSTFATTTQFGSTVASPNGSHTVAGSQTLSGGTNYFWLTYDVPSGATLNNFIDAQCTSLTVGSARTPTATNPAGNRQILNISTIGTGTSTQSYPFYTNYGYTRSASIYTSAEVGAPTSITHLAWNIQTAQTANIPVKIYLKSTTASTVTADTWANLIAGATLVYDATVQFSPTGWKTFDITDFNYCQDNLMVLCEANYGGSGAGATVSFYYTTTGTNMHEYFYQDASAPTGTGYTSTSRPNIQISKATAGSMSYVSCTTTQTNTSGVQAGSTSAEVVGIQIVTTGCGSPIAATSFSLNTTGTTAPATDITNGKLWYTGTSGTFATGTQYGSTVAAPNGAFNFAGSQNLNAGTNYFWLTYDVSGTATAGNVIDAQCTALNAGGARTPTTTNPAGSRPIVYETTIGAGVSTGSYPFYTGWGYTRSASLYTQAEIGGPMRITHLSWNVSTSSTTNIPCKIYLTTTTATSLSSETWANMIAGATLVYDATRQFNATGWNQIDITDFTYCSGNLVVLCEANYGGSGTSGPSFYYTTTTSSHETWYADSSPPTGTGSVGSSRPNIKMNYAAAAGMSYVSSTVTQPNTSYVSQGSTNQDIICIQVVTSGCLTPIDATSFSLNTTGSTNAVTDVSNGKLYYTGNGASFSAINQFGSTVVAPNGAFSFTGTQTLTGGTNYFWLSYDIPVAATIGNVVDAQCTSLNAGGVRTPSTTAPAGNRQILNIYLISGGGVKSTCSGKFYDSGGSASNYNASENYEITFQPATPGNLVRMTFNSFATESSYDYLYIYDGPNTTSPQVAGSPFSGATSPGTITAGTLGGELTFRFTSDGGTQGAGWDADISCIATPTMSYVSSAVTQAVTTDVVKGTVQAQIIGIQIVTTGIASPLMANSFTFATTGTTNPATDIENAKLFYTGTTGTFATTNQVGSTVAAPNGAFNIDPGQQLSQGTNYFWLTYDVKLTATTNNVADARCNSINISSTAYTPSPSNPAGTRRIVDCVCGTGYTTIAALPYSGAGLTTCGSVNDLTSANTTVCGSTSYYTGEDHVFEFTPTTTGTITLTLNSTTTYTGMALYQGCFNLGGGGTCVGYVQTSSSGSKNFCANVVAGQRYFVIVDTYAAPACITTFTLDITSPVVNACPASLGTGLVAIAALPYSSTGRTTCGKVNDLFSGDCKTTLCGTASYYDGEDEIFYFTAPSTGMVTINLTSTGSYTGLMVYNGCPTGGGTCVDYRQSSSGSKSMCVSVTSGNTYYIVIDSDPSPACNPYDISVSAPSIATTGFTCATANAIPSLPYNVSGMSTACTGNDYTSGSTGSCSSSYLGGEDYVFSYTTTGAECIGITLSNCNAYASFSVYSGCPGTAGTTCLGTFHSATVPFSGSVTLPAAGTYYIIIDTDNSGSTPFNLSVVTYGTGQSNDLPCDASFLTMGAAMSGDNNCSGSTGEPAVPTCWTSGIRNTVWYKFTAPVSGEVKIRTALGSLQNTQIALYSGACGAGMTMIACNDNQPTCGSNVYNMSEITATGLTPSTTYYIAVDGTYDAVGTFTIMVLDNSIQTPGAMGQDCIGTGVAGSGIVTAIPVCGSAFTVGNPGYQAVGNICDFDGSTICLASGERGAVWYNLPINANGNLVFTLVPNDYDGTTGNETDYDFAVWKVVGSGAVSCTDILNGAMPDRCNYSYLGVTGLYAAGNAPAPYTPGYDGAFESQLPVLNGEVYVLVISNFTNSTSGFSIDFTGTSPINYPASPTTLIWSGGAGNTDWFNPMNWGNCAVYPNENIDVIIPPASTFMPVIDRIDPNNGNNARCKSITINPAANVSLTAGYTLEIYGNFDNQGILNASNNSIALMRGSANQTMDGSMVGTSKFGIFTVNKTGGNLTLTDNLEIGSNFTTSNATSLFVGNGYTISIGGNINLFASTFTPGPSGVAIINGSGNQTATTNGNTFSNFTMDKTGGTLTLVDNLTVNRTLTLTYGVIATGANWLICGSNLAANITGHNINSYVNGKLRKTIASNTSTYALPVGTATTYRLAEFINNNIAGVTYLEAQFLTTYTNSGAMDPAKAVDGGTPYVTIATEGIWQIDPNAAPSGGSYSMRLYFDGGGANAFAGIVDNQFGPLKRSSASTSAFDWTAIGGTLNAASSPGRTLASGYGQRNGWTTFSHFALGLVNSPLPIELLDFTGVCKNNQVELVWRTAQEIRNDYFTVEKSLDGINFSSIGVVSGAGNSSTPLSYRLTDTEPGANSIYYRLKQTDFDGTSTVSGIITVHCEIDVVNDQFTVINLPEDQNLTIEFGNNFGDTYIIELTDNLGRTLVSDEFIVTAPGQVYTLDKSRFAIGLYNLVIRSTDNVFTKQMVISDH